MPQKNCYTIECLFSLLLLLLPFTAISCRPCFFPIFFHATPALVSVRPSLTESSGSIPGGNSNPYSMENVTPVKSSSAESSVEKAASIKVSLTKFFWTNLISKDNPKSAKMAASIKSSLAESSGSTLGGNANPNSVEKATMMKGSLTKFSGSNRGGNLNPNSVEKAALIKSNLAAPSGPNPGGNAKPNTKT